MSDRITLRIGVSRCLLGEEVRYDGTDRGALVPMLRDPSEPGPGAVTRDEGADPSAPAPRVVRTWESRRLELVPVCPEVEAGMGVPREPVRLEGAGAAPRMIAVTSRRNFTEAMLTLCARRIPEMGDLHGFIFKKGSPSCGVRGVGRYSPDQFASATPAETGMGLFAAAVERAHPGIPLVDETDLPDDAAWRRFLDRADRFATRARS